MLQVRITGIVEQILSDTLDTLKTITVYQYELEDVVVRLEDAQRQNSLLTLLLVCLSVIFLAVVAYLIRRYRMKMRSGHLANRLLKQQAAAMHSIMRR